MQRRLDRLVFVEDLVFVECTTWTATVLHMLLKDE
jgi:hypothetical protein